MVVKFSIDFQSDRVREFTSVIAQQDREKLHKPVRAEFPIEPFNHIKNGSRCISVHEESEHELAFDKVERQQNFSTFAALNRIHLNNGTVRASFQEREDFLFRDADTGMCLRAYDFAFMLGCLCRVDMLFQSIVLSLQRAETGQLRRLAQLLKG